MIKRILNTTEFEIVCDDIFDLFDQENLNAGHIDLPHSKEAVLASCPNEAVLAWSFFVWANENTHGRFDAIIAFEARRNRKFDAVFFSEVIWLSKNPKVGIKLFNTAMDFLNDKPMFNYVVMESVESNGLSDKLEKFYTSQGFSKDSTTYIKKL